MEEILPNLKNLFTSAIEIKVDEANLTLSMIVKRKEIRGDFATPKEVRNMLKIFGGLKENIPMEIEIDDKAKKIDLKFQNKADLEKIREIMDNIWDRTIQILEKAIAGDFGILKDIGD
ncbi:MAG: hypothetical protein ACFFDN_30790, partial [Candidatus Hodarchaeota archaeon]